MSKAGLCSIAILAALSAILPGPIDLAAPSPLPVILIYGFQPVPGFYPPQLWAEFAEELSGRPVGEAERIELEPGHDIYRLPAEDEKHRDVFISDYGIPYEPTVRDLRSYAARLADEISWVKEDRSVEAVDLIGHSMGGLVARSYIEADDFTPVLGDPDFPDYGTAYRGDVRTLVTLAAPHHGAGFAAIGPWLGPLFPQLTPGSAFLALLNRPNEEEISIPSDVRYISLAGQTCLGCGLRGDPDTCRRECVRAGLAWEGSDLVVKMSSAYLPGAENVACIGMDHIDMHTSPAIASLLVDILDGKPAPPVIYGSDELRAAAED